MFAGSMLGLMAGVLFTGTLAYASVSDLRTRRIPNRLVLLLAVSGLVFSTALDPLLPGLWNGLRGLAVGLALWLPLYLLGWLGAGDVKLFAAAGAWLGPAGALEGTVYAGLAGGLLALVWLLYRRGLAGPALAAAFVRFGWRELVRAPRNVPHRERLPYGIALALGALLAAWFPGIILGG
jgi:prepilin peptidase CpaA